MSESKDSTGVFITNKSLLYSVMDDTIKLFKNLKIMATNKEKTQLESMLKARINADSKNIKELGIVANNSIYSKLYQDIIDAQSSLLNAIQD